MTVMNYAIDQIVEDIVILENITTGEKQEVNKTLLPSEIKEGSIIAIKNNQYILNTTEEESRKNRLKAKLERLKRLQNKG